MNIEEKHILKNGLQGSALNDVGSERCSLYNGVVATSSMNLFVVPEQRLPFHSVVRHDCRITSRAKVGSSAASMSLRRAWLRTRTDHVSSSREAISYSSHSAGIHERLSTIPYDH